MPNRVPKNLSTIPVSFFLARKKESLRLPDPVESGHTPFFISLLIAGRSSADMEQATGPYTAGSGAVSPVRCCQRRMRLVIWRIRSL